MEAVKLPSGLLDKTYDKRKNAALEVERIIRDCLAHGEMAKVQAIVSQLVDLASSPSHQSNLRNGGIMGLAGASISLGQQNIAPYLGQIAPPILACFHDPDHRVRYFACESMYNVAKVAKGEILVYFNELFDAMSKLAADVDQAVKNGGELLDRQIKDIVVEQASTYVSLGASTPTEPEVSSLPGTEGSESRLTEKRLRAHADGGQYGSNQGMQNRRAFSLERFIPLLAERIHVINPFTRTYLVTWLTVLDSLPELELVSYLPHFLDGLLKFLQDPTEDIRNATMHVLADFLKEIQEAAEVARIKREARQARREKKLAQKRDALRSRSKGSRRKSVEPGDISITNEPDTYTAPVPRIPSRRQSPRRAPDSSAAGAAGPSSPSGKDRENVALNDISEESITYADQGADDGDRNSDALSVEGLDLDDVSDEDAEGEGTGRWVPGQGVKLDHAAIVEILLRHLERGDEEIQATCLRWINEFLHFAKDTMITFTPRLIKLILPSLAHHFPAISHVAKQANYNLFRVVQISPAPRQAQVEVAERSPEIPQTSIGHNRRNSASAKSLLGQAATTSAVPFPSSSSPNAVSTPNSRQGFDRSANLDDMINEMNHSGNLLDAPATIPDTTVNGQMQTTLVDSFDYQLTVGVLLERLLDDSEETRVAAFQWLSMLHQKAPKKILGMHETFPVLLKMLSDPAEEVIKANLQLLAQISSSSEEDSYFPVFMSNLLQIFSTDRKLLETRGSLIIRQLCSSLNTERIYRTFADLLEKDEDLDFASIMVQNLHTIMITSPELSDFRKRLKNLDSRDGQILFVNLYRSWSHNAVAAFSLCLLAQAYEHAANLLQIFADLEVTVSLLIQIDKLVQLLESPVFTSMRLQLLEPEKYPYLFKCLYGLLMFLPQSSAFLTLRNRLNAVSPLGFIHVAPKASSSSSQGPSLANRSTIRRNDDVKWPELLTHFRQLQMKHERARRTHSNDTDGQSAASAPLALTVRPSGSSAPRRKQEQGQASGSRISSGSGRPPSTTSKASPLGSRPLSPQLQPTFSVARPQKRVPSVGRPRPA